MMARRISALVCGGGLVLFFVLAPIAFPNHIFRKVVADVVPLAVTTATIFVMIRNAAASRGHTRLFWGLMTAGMSMWWLTGAGWVWFEVIVGQPVPDPFEGDIVLFLHFVPMMAAIAIRPPKHDTSESMAASALNVIILLMWWIVVYAFVVFPEEYLVRHASYMVRWDFLYMAEAVILIGVAGWSYLTSMGSWRSLYGHIVVATLIYAISSQIINAAIERGTYVSGGLADLPFLLAQLAYLRVAIFGRRCLREIQAAPSVMRDRGVLASLLAKLALLSLPVMGYWELFMSHDAPYLRQVRFAVAMGGVAILAFFVFLKQHLLDRRLVQLLRQSRASFDNLQRLQGRVVQQAKLASLGELVAMAASELEHPLSAVLDTSERLAASSNLSREQLATAQKIGQQARRTRDLVNDLLSFAQQTPGEKVPLELKPLLQRAVQMEGFKLQNKEITLSVHTADLVPRVQGNSNQLLQAFLQIVENAVDALQEVGRGRLIVSVWYQNDEVVIEFADTGPGLRDPERVFDPFYTTKPIGKGTGLGLSATYGVIQDHQGQITCANRAEGGAVFEIRLPAMKAGMAFAEAAQA